MAATAKFWVVAILVVVVIAFHDLLCELWNSGSKTTHFQGASGTPDTEVYDMNWYARQWWGHWATVERDGRRIQMVMTALLVLIGMVIAASLLLGYQW